jgi:hypothetical protein
VWGGEAAHYTPPRCIIPLIGGVCGVLDSHFQEHPFHDVRE